MRVTGTVQDGRLKFDAASLAQLHAFIRTREGRSLTLTVTGAKRTDPQNRLLHVYVPMIAEHFGYVESAAMASDAIVADVKRDLMGACYGWTTGPMGNQVPTRPHTSSLSVDEMTDFLDWLYRFCAEHGLVLPDAARAA